MLAFSTANTVPRDHNQRVWRFDVLADRYIDPLYSATLDATEEAILNALCAAEPMTGRDGHHAPALPVDELLHSLGDRNLGGGILQT